MRVIGDQPTSRNDEYRAVGKLRRAVCLAAEKEGSRIGVGVSECSSPAKVAISRLLAIVKKFRGGKVLAIEEEKEFEDSPRCLSDDRQVNNVSVNEDIKQNRRKRKDKTEDFRRDSPRRLSEDLPSNDHESGCRKREMTFNLAAGIGLLSLIASSKTELEKTMELRKEMEGFLKSIKEAHHSDGTTPKPVDHGHGYAVSTTMDGLSNVSHYSFDDHTPSFCQPESGISMVCDNRYSIHENEVSFDGMNHLEEELAAELDRLQVDKETEEMAESQKVNAEVSSTDMTTQSECVSSGEVVVDPQDDYAVGNNEIEFCGVPPLELERRLHELLESRQEERIKELEARVEGMKRRLQEKEVEITWWKDTAKIMSKQLPDTSQFIR